jgi:hypothetical protein
LFVGVEAGFGASVTGFGFDSHPEKIKNVILIIVIK